MTSHPPSFDDVEAAFLDEHWAYGGAAHRTTAKALVAALGEASEPHVGHVLFARLFSEYAAALETFGAWAWAIRNRSARGGLMRAFLGYRNRDVGNLYRDIQSHNGDLVAFLNLPQVADAYEAVHAVASASGMAFSEEDYWRTLDTRYRNLHQAAEQWFASDRVIVEAYNKAKHGATLVRLFGREDPRRFQIVLVDDNKDLRYADFTVTPELVRQFHTNVDSATAWIADLVGLAKILRDAHRL